MGAGNPHTCSQVLRKWGKASLQVRPGAVVTLSASRNPGLRTLTRFGQNSQWAVLGRWTGHDPSWQGFHKDMLDQNSLGQNKSTAPQGRYINPSPKKHLCRVLWGTFSCPCLLFIEPESCPRVYSLHHKSL